MTRAKTLTVSILVRMAPATIESIAGVLRRGEDRSAFIREAIDAAVVARRTPREPDAPATKGTPRRAPRDQTRSGQ